MKPNNVVAIYRVSSKKQLENESIPRQRDEARSYCRKKGYEILKEFVLAETASKVKERHEFEKVIQYCMMNHKKISAVVIWKVSRFTRGGMDVYYMLKALLAQKGIRIESATENIDETPMGEWAEGMLAVQARFDSRQRTDITIGAEKRLVRRGFWCRPAPTGFENVKIPMYDEESGTMKKRPVLMPTRDQRQWELLQYGLRKQMTGMYKI
jgi:site-specific DNA recombinase